MLNRVYLIVLLNLFFVNSFWFAPYLVTWKLYRACQAITDEDINGNNELSGGDYYYDYDDSALEGTPFPTVFTDLKSSETVFSFIHLRKAGGSSIRKILGDGFAKAGLHENNTVMIFACYFRCHCSTHTIDHHSPQICETTDTPVRVIGHIPFAEVQLAADMRALDVDKITCLTQIRDVHSRVLSCFYYRAKEANATMSLTGNLTVEEYRTILKNFRDIFGYGCNNEMLRLFGDVRDERVLNGLTSESGEVHLDRVMETAKRNLERCVILKMGETEINNQIVKHWLPALPWLWQQSEMENVERYPEDINKLPREFHEVISEINSYDEVLYEYATRLHQRLYRVSRMHNKNRC